MRLLICLLFICSSAYSNTIRIGLTASLLSKNLTGVDSAGDEGNLVSNTNFHYGLNLRYALSKSWHFLLNYQNKSYSFDNTQEVIEGEEAFTLTQTSTGVRWVIHPRVAFRFLLNVDEQLAFSVNASDLAEVYSENLSYASIFYDQVVFMGRSMFSGFKLGYDLPGSGDTISNRTAVHYGIFMVLDAFEIFYGIRNITLETNDLTFTDDESVLNFTYVLRF